MIMALTLAQPLERKQFKSVWAIRNGICLVQGKPPVFGLAILKLRMSTVDSLRLSNPVGFKIPTANEIPREL